MSDLTRLERIGIRLLGIHSFIYEKTDGRVGHRIPGMPSSLLLHTVGAKTGKARTSTLTYARDGGSYLVVASMGGAPKSPGWYHNITAHPDVEINVGRARLAVTAHPVLPGDPDYARLWRTVNTNNANRYEAYQRRTTRKIPIVVLSPRR